MKNLKKILLLVFCLALAMSISLVSCEQPETPPEHTHTWSEWTVTTPAECGGTGTEGRICTSCLEPETRSYTASHEGAIICENCGAAALKFDAFDFSAVKSFGIKISDLEAIVIQNDYSASNGTLTLENTELYVGLDDNDELTGYGKATLKTVYKNIPGGLTTTMEVVLYVEDTMVYIGAAGKSPLSNAIYNVNEYIACDISKIPELVTAKDLLEQSEGLIDEYAASLEEFFEDTLAPIFADVDVDDAIGAINAISVKYSARIINSLFVITDNGDGTSVATLSLDALKDFAEAALTNNIADFIDLIAGEGTVAALEDALTDEKLYNFTVAELIAYIEDEQGVDLVELLAALDELTVILSNETMTTLEEAIAFIMSSEDAPAITIPDLDSFLENDELLSCSVKYAISMMLGMMDDPTTEDDEVLAYILPLIEDAFDYVAETSIFDLISSMGGQLAPEGPEVTPMTDSETDPLEAMLEEINEAIDAVAGLFSFEIQLGANNAVTSIDIAFSVSSLPMVPAEIAYDFEISVTAEKITVKYDMSVEEAGMEQSCTIELIPDFTVAHDSAKIADLKAKINSISNKVTLDAITGEYIGEETVKVIKDTANGYLYIIALDIEFVGSSNEIDYAKIEINRISISDIGGYAWIVTPGCSGSIEMSVCIASKYVAAELSSYDEIPGATQAQLIALILNDFTASTIEAKYGEAWETNTYSFDALYKNGTYTYVTGEHHHDGVIDLDGHTYVKQDATSTTGEDCTTVYHTDYKCNCGATYVYYWTNGHRYTAKSTVNADDSLTLTYACKNCTHVYSNNIGSAVIDTNEVITLDATPDKQVYQTNQPATIAFYWNNEAATTLKGIFSYSAGTKIVNNVYVSIYQKNANNEYVKCGEVNLWSSDYDMNYNLEVGEYYFTVGVSLVDYMVMDGIEADVTIYFETVEIPAPEKK